MCKVDTIAKLYEVANLSSPSDEVVDMLMAIEFDRIVELMLVMRKAGRIKSPVNFLRRAIEEGWTAESSTNNVNRRVQRITEEKYISRGYDRETARRKALEVATDY